MSYPTHTYNIYLYILSSDFEILPVKQRKMNCKIHPVLYHFYLRLKDVLGAEIVHRRRRTSNKAIEVIFHCEESFIMTGRLNSLPEAEKCGFWVMCRPQTKPDRMFYKGHRVYQLFLSPVHPKKRREMTKIITPLHQPESIAIGA